MKITRKQIELLKKLMVNSARKGNLANAGLVLENGKMIAFAESLVVSNNDATAHSERMLVTEVCQKKKNNYTPGLIMITVIEPCLMCMSACAWAGYKEIGYIIPAKKYLDKIPWMAEIRGVDKERIAQSFSEPVKLVHLSEYEDGFSEVFEREMGELLRERIGTGN